MAEFPLAAAAGGRVKTGSLLAIVAVAGTVLAERVVRQVARAVAFSTFCAVALVVRTSRHRMMLVTGLLSHL